MALVKLKDGTLNDVSPIKIAQMLGLDPATQQKLLSLNVKFIEHKDLLNGGTMVCVTATSKCGETFTVNTKVEVDKLLWAASDGYQLGKGAVQIAVMEAINKLHQHFQQFTVDDVDTGTMESPSPVSLAPMMDEQLAVAMPTVPKWATDPFLTKDVLSIKEATEMLSASPSVAKKVAPPKQGKVSVDVNLNNRVKLRNATMLYEPTFGTDNDSMYHVIALGNGLNASGRIRTNFGVSIRLEGPVAQDDTFKQKAMSAGLVASGDAHISLHVQADSEQHAVMALGAMLASVPFEFSETAPVLKAILYKGV